MESCKIPAFARVWQSIRPGLRPCTGLGKEKARPGQDHDRGRTHHRACGGPAQPPCRRARHAHQGRASRRAQLTRPPAQVRLWFNEEVEKDYASLTVIQGDKPVTEASPG